MDQPPIRTKTRLLSAIINANDQARAVAVEVGVFEAVRLAVRDAVGVIEAVGLKVGVPVGVLDRVAVGVLVAVGVARMQELEAKAEATTI